MSASSFGGKVGSGLGTSVIGWCLAAVGYNSKLAVATGATKAAIYGFSIVIPFLLFVTMFILVTQFDLERKLPQMRAEMEAKKAQ